MTLHELIENSLVLAVAPYQVIHLSSCLQRPAHSANPSLLRFVDCQINKALKISRTTSIRDIKPGVWVVVSQDEG